MAAHQVVVRGRGLFAELAGSVKVGGSTAAPQPLGSFHMVRGNLSIAGQTLNFDKGEIGFSGGSLTDPSLDFVATSANSTVSASLSITGSASNPKITLSSTPELPQDEVLAQLLFHRSSTSLSPFQLAAIAGSLAELSGATSAAAIRLAGSARVSGLNSCLSALGQMAARHCRSAVTSHPASISARSRARAPIAAKLRSRSTSPKASKRWERSAPAPTRPRAPPPADSAGTSLGLKYQFDY